MIQLCTALTLTLASASWGIHAHEQPPVAPWTDSTLPMSIPEIDRLEVIIPPAVRHVSRETPPYILEMPTVFLD